MKFQITMKDPDGCFDCMRNAAKESLPEGLSESEADILTDEREAQIHKICATWFRYGEYLTVEVDSDAGTCIVLPSK